MAETKISALPASASMAAAAILPVVQAGVTEKATALQVKTYVKDAIVSDGTFATDTAVVHLGLSETITGTKTFSTNPTVVDSLYGVAWNGNAEPATKNSIYDQIETMLTSIALKAVDTAVVHLTGNESVAGTKTFTSVPQVPEDPYAVGWDLNTGVATKNAIYDKIETLVTSIALKAVDTAVVHNTGAENVAGVKTFSSDPIIPDEAYAVGWDGSLEPPTKNAVYDKIQSMGAGITNLTYTASATNGIVVSDTGTDATLTLATGTNAGLLAPADFTRIGTSVQNAGAETIAGVKTFSSVPLIPDDAYAVGWNANLGVPTKNAVYDQLVIMIADTATRATDSLVVHLAGTENITGTKSFAVSPTVADEAYGVAWNGSTAVPTKNAVYDKIETLGAGGATNLTYTAAASNGTVVSDTGTDATLTAATGTNAGLMLPADFTKLAAYPATPPVTTVKQTSALTTTATALADIVGLSFAVTSGRRYHVKFIGTVRSAATTTGIAIGFSGPAMTSFMSRVYVDQGAAGVSHLYTANTATVTSGIGSISALAAATDFTWSVEVIFQPSASGTLQCRGATKVAASQVIFQNTGMGILTDAG